MTGIYWRQENDGWIDGYVGGQSIFEINIEGKPPFMLLSRIHGVWQEDLESLEAAKAKASELLSEWIEKTGLVEKPVDFDFGRYMKDHKKDYDSIGTCHRCGEPVGIDTHYCNPAKVV